MKPQKYAARRTTKDNQMIATIGTGGGVGPSGSGGGGGGQNMGMQPQSSSSSSSMYDRDPRHTQVKTYTDHGNGHSLRSTGGPTQYSKVGYATFPRINRFHFMIYRFAIEIITIE